jgi:hypothetical protein
MRTPVEAIRIPWVRDYRPPRHMTAVFTHLANLATPVLIPRPGIFVAPASLSAAVPPGPKASPERRLG